MLSPKHLKRHSIIKSMKLSMNKDNKSRLNRNSNNSYSIPKFESDSIPGTPSTVSISDYNSKSCKTSSSSPSSSSTSWKTDITLTPVNSFKVTKICKSPSKVNCVDECNCEGGSSNNSDRNVCNPSQRKVSFSTKVRVYLIPTREEFAPIAPKLWWTLSECEGFKRDAYSEVRGYVVSYKCSVKEAMFDLYSPSSFDEETKISLSMRASDNQEQLSLFNDNRNTANVAGLQQHTLSIFDKWAPIDFTTTSSPHNYLSKSSSSALFCEPILNEREESLLYGRNTEVDDIHIDDSKLNNKACSSSTSSSSSSYP